MDGKKTWLGLVIMFAPQLVSDLSDMLNGGATVEKGIVFAGKLLAVIGAVHKLIKASTAPATA